MKISDVRRRANGSERLTSKTHLFALASSVCPAWRSHHGGQLPLCQKLLSCLWDSALCMHLEYVFQKISGWRRRQTGVATSIDLSPVQRVLIEYCGYYGGSDPVTPAPPPNYLVLQTGVCFLFVGLLVVVCTRLTRMIRVLTRRGVSQSVLSSARVPLESCLAPASVWEYNDKSVHHLQRQTSVECLR